MKKVFALVLILMLVVTILVSCDDDMHTYKMYNENDFEIAYSEKLQDAVIGVIRLSDENENIDIVIPNTYKDAKVTSLGGLVGTSAGVNCRIDYKGWMNSSISQDYNTKHEIESYLNASEIKEIVLNFYIGSNLKKIDEDYSILKCYRIMENNQGNKVVEMVCFNVIVDKDNETFYSDNLGRMYYKENNKLVTSLIYKNRDSFPENSL